MDAYPTGGFRLARLEPGSPASLLDAVAGLVAEQAAEEGRTPPSGVPARLRALAQPGSGAVVHALVASDGEPVAYQVANACAVLGGRYAYVNETFVPAERRGLGLGYVLMRLFVDWARAEGFTHVYSWTRSPEMRRVAEALGAKVKPVEFV
jgi:GNAT superfamily N-acetyltransferase